VVIRVRPLWFHGGALFVSVLSTIGFWYFAFRSTETRVSTPQRELECSRLAAQLRNRVVATYSQHLIVRLEEIKNIPSGLGKRAIEMLSSKASLSNAGNDKIALIGGQRLLRRDTEATVDAILFACRKELPNSNIAVSAIPTTIYRDLALAAYDAAEADANAIRVKLTGASPSTSKEPTKSKTSERGRSGAEKPVKKSEGKE